MMRDVSVGALLARQLEGEPPHDDLLPAVLAASRRRKRRRTAGISVAAILPVLALSPAILSGSGGKSSPVAASHGFSTPAVAPARADVNNSQLAPYGSCIPVRTPISVNGVVVSGGIR